ncbi:MAG: thiamine-monophosphate kinase [Actinomycetota bacterium]|nr:thiamine-monophosphate kinase [Actinomycetota bacterium]
MTERVVSELGESGLIDRILARIGAPPGGAVGGGDDTAVVSIGTESVLFTTDALVEGIDFDFSYCSGADVGWKAIAVNASDIASMCGAPLWATVSMALPADTPVATVDSIIEGMLEAAEAWDIGVVGGDISRASEMSLSVAMLGSPAIDAPVMRAGAKVGDALCLTGSVGGAAAGLRLLQHQAVGGPRADDHPSGQTSSSGAAMAGLVARQLRPVARVREAALLARSGPSSMIDLSDGLALDLSRVMRASATGCEVDDSAIPLDPGLAALFGADREAALELAMTGGEDFELLFTIADASASAAIAAVEQMGTACTRIGNIVDSGCTVGDRPLSEWEGLGWDHLQSR